MTTRRLLLLEFLIPDRSRNTNGDLYPFYAALARACAAEVRWLTYGTDWESDDRGHYRAALAEKDRESLRVEVADFSPTAVVISESLTDDDDFWLSRELLKNVTVVDMNDVRRRHGSLTSASGCSSGAVSAYTWTTYALSESALPLPWMARPDVVPRPQSILDVRPDYDARMMNRAARENPRLIRIMGGRPCTAHAPLRDNPFLAGLDLSQFPDGVGCSFCQRSVWAFKGMDAGADPLERAVSQLERLRQSWARDGREYSFYDQRVFYRLPALFEALRELDFPASVFHFSPRVDDFLQVASSLERLLPKIGAAGHRINLLTIGIENFSAVEQTRLNKGFGPEIAVEGVRRILSLAGRFPRQLTLPGFGFILFSPYTTPDDVALNLRVFRETGVRLCGHILTTLTQLDAGTPLAQAVERDGLLRAEWPRPGMTYNPWVTRALRPNQLRWDFKHREVGTLYAALVRVVSHANRSVYGTVLDPDEPAMESAVAFYDALDEAARDWGPLADSLVEATRSLSGRDFGVPDLLASASSLLRSAEWRARRGWPADDSEATEPPEKGKLAPSELPLKRSEQGLARSVSKLRLVSERMAGLEVSPLAPWRVAEVREQMPTEDSGYAVRVALESSAARMDLTLRPSDSPEPALLEGPGFRMAHDPATPPDTPEKQHTLRVFASLLHQLLRRS